MRIRSMNSWHARVGSVLLTTVAAAALSAAAAQEPPPADSAEKPPAIALPAVPEAGVTLEDKGQSNSGTSAVVPAAPPSQTDASAPVTTPPANEPSPQPAVSVPAAAAGPAEAAPAPEPVAALPLPPLDAALKDDLDDLAKKDLPRGSAGTALRNEYAALAAFYADRNYAPLWNTDGNWTQAAKSALARLKRADEDGLEIKASALPMLSQGEPASLAASELALSEAVVDYGRQASGGRIDPRIISPLITEKPAPAAPAQILNTVANASDAGNALENFNPPQAGYKALRQKLAELRHSHGNIADHIPNGPVLKLGMKDSRVPLIRARFDLGPDAQTAQSGLLYDTKVADAVADFQRSSGLPVSGTLTARTVMALSHDQPLRLENEILINMERWRWMAHQIEPDQIDVNVPDFTVSLVYGGTVVHTARVVVGKPDTPTPIFSNTMKYVEINPYWDVPQSIIHKEMMPHLAADPNYLQRQGYEVTMRHGELTVRQPPGPRNALGQIKFMFPNEHAVYLHDTPEKALFADSRRAFSHGCVRVQNPMDLAPLVLGADWPKARIEKLVGGPNRTVHLPKALPIHIEYFTTWVDAKGALQSRDDVYGYSRKMKVALGLRD
jgi:murein L,D-transpeptidase YcbB/YkuD